MHSDFSRRCDAAECVRRSIPFTKIITDWICNVQTVVLPLPHRYCEHIPESSVWEGLRGRKSEELRWKTSSFAPFFSGTRLLYAFNKKRPLISRGAQQLCAVEQKQGQLLCFVVVVVLETRDGSQEGEEWTVSLMSTSAVVISASPPHCDCDKHWAWTCEHPIFRKHASCDQLLDWFRIKGQPHSWISGMDIRGLTQETKDPGRKGFGGWAMRKLTARWAAWRR